MMVERTGNQQDIAGFIAGVFAHQIGFDQSVMINGADDEADWSYTLSHRAALGLWYDLTRLLFPEKSDQVIAQVSTLRPLPRTDADDLELTAVVFVTALAEGECQLEGWTGASSWQLRLNTYAIYRFWAALDAALYPSGW